MSDDVQYQPIRWHFPPQVPRDNASVTWIAVGSPAQVDGRYMDGGIWVPDKGKPVTGVNKIVQWRHRLEVAR